MSTHANLEATAKVTDHGAGKAGSQAMAHAAAHAWSGAGSASARDGSQSSMSEAEAGATINGALKSDIYSNSGNSNIDCSPTAHLDSLYKSEDSFSDAQSDMQSALDMIRNGDTKCGVQKLSDSISDINQGMSNVQDGVGGSFDLSQLDTSDPLRRVGSGRQAIKSGRSDLEDALANLNGDSPDSAAAIQSIEKALTNVDGGAANIHKAVGLEESGQPDHRPEASAATGDILSQPAQPTAIDSVQAQPAPPVVHQKEYNDGQRHLGNSTGGLRGARSSIEQGDMNEAGKDLKYSLKELQSGTKDLRYSFGNVLPGEDSFNTADSQMLDALSAFQKNDYNETLAYIHRALNSVSDGQSDTTGDQ